MIITWIVGLLSVVYIVGLAIIGPPVIRANLPGASRRERALRMAGRLALPAPDDEQCRRRRALLDASGRPDPTSIPGCGTDESAQWDPVRCGWVRERDGEFMPWRPSSATRLPDPGPGIRVTR